MTRSTASCRRIDGRWIRPVVRPDHSSPSRGTGLFSHRRQFRAAGLCAIFLSAILSPAAPGTTAAQGTAPAAAEARDPPPLPRDLLKDPKVIAQGEALWKEQCTLCHGAKAYPGKAPRLQPHRISRNSCGIENPQWLPEHALPEGALHSGAGDRACRLCSERRVLAVAGARLRGGTLAKRRKGGGALLARAGRGDAFEIPSARPCAKGPTSNNGRPTRVRPPSRTPLMTPAYSGVTRQAPVRP